MTMVRSARSGHLDSTFEKHRAGDRPGRVGVKVGAVPQGATFFDITFLPIDIPEKGPCRCPDWD